MKTETLTTVTCKEFPKSLWIQFVTTAKRRGFKVSQALRQAVVAWLK